jgi:hypothetical protein
LPTGVPLTLLNKYYQREHDLGHQPPIYVLIVAEDTMGNEHIRPSPAKEDLYAALSVLALITERLPDLDLQREPGSESEEPKNSDLLPRGRPAPVPNTRSDENHELDLSEAEDGRDSESTNEYLRSKVLDRLAEVLARFKSVPGRGVNSSLGSKHVSSTLMFYNETKVRILCAKNEGFDQEDSDDSDFLAHWARWMQSISEKGKSAKLC